uniref:C2H2-type domain-containing protein n=1 Tax=Anopheles minimus TaxID=112268 RepID=A0A182VUN0_9DIPT
EPTANSSDFCLCSPKIVFFFNAENTVHKHRKMSRCNITSRMLACKICAKSLPRKGLKNITDPFTSGCTIAETLAKFAGIKLASHPALNEGFICIENCCNRLRAAIEYQDILKKVFEQFGTENDETKEGDRTERDSITMTTTVAHDRLNVDDEHHLELEESMETKSAQQLGRPFVIPKLDYVNTHMRFTNLEYIELSGPMCCGCDFIAKTTHDLMDHITEIHSRINGSKGSTACDVCYETCEDEYQLQIHRQWFLNTEIFLCKYCSYIFTCKENLMQHMSICIEQIACASDSNDNDKLAVDEALEMNKSQPVVKCCMPAMISDKQKEKQIDDELVTKRDDYDTVLQPANANDYGCCFVRCNATFERESELHHHVQELHAVRQRIHRSERTSDRYVCETCQLGFKSSKTFERHRNGWKLKQRNVCNHCGKGFLTPGALQDHVQVSHIDTSPQFRCENCGKQFRKKSLLKLHLVTHQQHRRYGCDCCDARFHFGYQLKNHQQAVHPMEFPYECQHCNRKMPNKHRYDLHVRMHTGEQPYACRHDCGRKFAHATDRRRHEMVTHTGEKPHRCNSCSMAYVRRRELQQHHRLFPSHVC